jgi:hypothetical protein
MKSIAVLLLIITTAPQIAKCQKFNAAINKDSLFKTIVKDMREDKKKEFLTQYNSANEQAKEFLLVMFSMPRSSKKELVENIKSNYASVAALKTGYEKLVPKIFFVSIEFDAAENLLSMPESISLTIEKKIGKDSVPMQDWNLPYHSDKLDEMLKVVGWSYETLKAIKKLLDAAHCISIENREITDIGFARSGMGKYSYLLFDKDLTREQIKKYNDGCSAIFYKKNIVLEYGGGAIGPDCFPDK